MRQIGSLKDEEQARRLGDYLIAQGIPNQVESASDGWAIWVHDDNHLDAASDHLAGFRQDPENERYRDASRAAAEARRVEQEEERRAAENFIDVRKGWHRRAGGVRPVTTLLMAASVVVGIATQLGARMDGLGEHLLFGLPDGTGFELIRQGQVWRLFTPMFLHFGIFHLVFNLFWLYDLGGAIEIVKGTFFFIVLVLITGALSGIGQTLVRGPDFGGMSGVNYGLFGYIWMKEQFQPHEALRLAPGTVYIMLAWLFLCMTGVVGPVANTGHVVGLMTGMAFGVAPYLWRRARRSIR